MTKSQKETPAATNSRGTITIHRPTLIANNPMPRQCWCSNPPLKLISVSPALKADIIVMTKGEWDDGK